MSHLSIRVDQEDENNISLLQSIWGLGRSESARRAIAVAAALAEEKKPKDKKEILATSKFVGSFKEKSSSITYKRKVRAGLRKKYEI